MASPARKRELGRGEKVRPGVWRLRLPLPWPGVPHGNAWAVAHGDGIVLFDTGIHEEGSWAELERALSMVGLAVGDVRLLVCSHAHSDHYGQAAPITEAAGCELWMHPALDHLKGPASDPEAWLEARLEVARQSGVPEAALAAYREARKGQGFSVAKIIDPDRPLREGMEIPSDLGSWRVIETPGHAPSHLCFFEPEHRLLISGDHLLGRVSPFYDYGYSDDPAGEFLRSLDKVEGLDARLCLSGHGRPFIDVGAHIEANRTLVRERIDNALAAIAEQPLTALEVQPHVHGQPANELTGNWWLSETLCYLLNLEREGKARRDGDAEDVERWVAT